MSNPFSNWTPQMVAEFNARTHNRANPPMPADAVEVESDLHDAIIKYCKHKGWIYFHGSMAHRTFRVTGEPDFQICADHGRTFLIECKTANGKLTSEQLGLALWAERLGHKIHLVRSVAEFLEVVK